MLDRKKGPPIFTEYDLRFDDYSSYNLPNGIEVTEINSGTQDIVKVDFIIRSGRVKEEKIGVAKAAIRLMREGTSTHNSEEIAHHFDFYGTSIKIIGGMDYSSISLVTMTRFFDEVFDIWMSLITDPAYDLNELEKYKQVQSQKLKNQLTKNDVLSYRKLTEVIFGEDHPYGYNTEPEDIHKISRQELFDFHNAYIKSRDSFVVISGHYSAHIKKKITDTFSSLNWSDTPSPATFYKKELSHQTIKIPTDNTHQTSIKIGRLLFDCEHEDRGDFAVLNTVLGGYFGSRLMKNIREEKGYTYGIYSIADLWRHGGYFYITTDVGNQYLEQTLEEIYKEIDLLRSTLIEDDEMKMVRNYMLGQSLNLIDGPFAKAQLIKNLKIKKMAVEDFYNRIERIKNINPHSIRDMAEKYLDQNTFTTVLAGGNSV